MPGDELKQFDIEAWAGNVPQRVLCASGDKRAECDFAGYASGFAARSA